MWDEPRPPGAPARVWRDWALVAVLVPLAVLEAVLRPDLPWRAVSGVVAVALVPTLLWRRTRPLLMIVIAFAASGLLTVVSAGHAADMYVSAYALLLPYSLARWGSGRELALGSAIVLAAFVLSVVYQDSPVTDIVGGAAVLSAAIAAGGAVRYRSRVRAHELNQVKLLEREQLARDLHDTVAHHVSAIVIRAQAGLATARHDPDAAGDALRLIEAEGSRALAELRTMVRVLRDDEPPELAPGARITDLEGFAGHPASGPPVHVELRGDLDDVPAPVSAAIYRLAQESVTNARRHAVRATRIDVTVTADDATVRLHVSDDGDARSARPPASPGYGLVGMIERAAVFGGTCVAGPDADRGWTVDVVLPRAGRAR